MHWIALNFRCCKCAVRQSDTHPGHTSAPVRHAPGPGPRPRHPTDYTSTCRLVDFPRASRLSPRARRLRQSQPTPARAGSAINDSPARVRSFLGPPQHARPGARDIRTPKKHDYTSPVRAAAGTSGIAIRSINTLLLGEHAHTGLLD